MPVANNEDELLTYDSLAAYLSVSKSKLRGDMCAGKIPQELYVKLFGGRSVRFLKSRVDQYLQLQSVSK